MQVQPTRGQKKSLSFGLAFCLVFVLPAMTGAVDSSLGAMLLIKNAQQGPVLSFATDTASKTIFVGSEDGSVQIWQGDNPDLVQRLQVSSRPILKLAAGVNDTLAVVEKSSGNNFVLSVWDWKTGHERFVLALDDQPLWLIMSPKASFVVAGLARPDGVAYFDAKTGAAINWPHTLTGIVDYALVSAKEERVMTYHAPSGTLTYTELTTGNLVAKFSSRQNLRFFQVVPDGTRSKAVAVDGQNLVLINLVTGTTLASAPMTITPQWLSTDETRPDIILAALPLSDGLRIQSFAIKQNGLAVQATEKITTGETTVSWIPFLGKNFAGDDIGQTWVSPGSTDPKKAGPRVLAERHLTRATGIGFSGTSLYVATELGLLRLDGNIFRPIGAGPVAAPQSPSPATQATASPGSTLPGAQLGVSPSPAAQNQRLTARVLSPPGTSLGIATSPDSSLLLWDSDKNPKLYRFETKNDSVSRISSSVINPFTRVYTDKSNVLTVETNGNVRTWSPIDFKQSYFHNSIGILSGSISSDGSLIIGRSATNESPLYRVVQKTGETVTIPDTDTAVYLMRTNPFDNNLYYLSIQSVAKDSQTFLKRIDGSGPTLAASQILSFAGEDSGGDVAFAPGSPWIYTSAGGRNVTVWDGRKSSILEETNRIPRQIAVGATIAAAINVDGSLSLWNTQTGAQVCDILILDSGVIVALTKKTEYYVLPRSLRPNTEPQAIGADATLAENFLGLPWSAKSAGTNAPIRLTAGPGF